ncbi:MAG: NAD(P)H-dependent oxidoreductase [Rhizobiales bacterium]|nr:NAD(P)H-dependent oxidoreductase [Hyphomicrobiales bacterium]
MHVLIVHAHPEPASFNGALTRRAVEALTGAGHTVTVSDLYAEGFDPVAGRHDFTEMAEAGRFHYQTEQAHAAKTGTFSTELAREQARVAEADLLVLQFPLWWGSPPAILKGWFERVLAYGFGYVDGARFDNGLFRGRRALMSVTTGGTPERFSAGGSYGEIDQVLYPVKHLLLAYMGYAVEEPFVAYAAPRISAEERAGYLDAFAQRLTAAAAKPTAPLANLHLRDAVGEAAWTRQG